MSTQLSIQSNIQPTDLSRMKDILEGISPANNLSSLFEKTYAFGPGRDKAEPTTFQGS